MHESRGSSRPQRTWADLQCTRPPPGALRDVQGHLVNLQVRLPTADEAREHEKVHKRFQRELLDAVGRQFQAFVADRHDLQAVTGLQAADQLDHLRPGFGLAEHERLEVLSRERAVFVKDRPIQVLVQAQLTHFVQIENQVMSSLQRLLIEAQIASPHDAAQCGPRRWSIAPRRHPQTAL